MINRISTLILGFGILALAFTPLTAFSKSSDAMVIAAINDENNDGTPDTFYYTNGSEGALVVWSDTSQTRVVFLIDLGMEPSKDWHLAELYLALREGASPSRLVLLDDESPSISLVDYHGGGTVLGTRDGFLNHESRWNLTNALNADEVQARRYLKFRIEWVTQAESTPYTAVSTIRLATFDHPTAIFMIPVESGLRLTVQPVIPGSTYSLETSTDLKSWTQVKVFEDIFESSFSVLEAGLDVNNNPVRFYRAVY